MTYLRLQPQAAEFQTVLDESMSSRTLQDSLGTPHHNLMTYSISSISTRTSISTRPRIKPAWKSSLIEIASALE